MPVRAKLWTIAGWLAVGAFLGVLAHLFALRFQGGEMFPPYSTFRADPLGCRAFYESLEALGKLSVSRNLDPMPALDPPRGRTLCVFGVRPSQLVVSPAEARELEGFVRGGGRLVITFMPTPWAPSTTTNQPPKKTDAAKKKKEHRFLGDLAGNWGVRFRFVPLPDENKPGRATACQSLPDLPDSISWHSTLVFTNLHPAWNVIYCRDHHPVLMERPLGNGTLVLAADTYLVSNEALLRERHPSLLCWLIGPAQQVIFDETHLGVTEQPGVAALLRKYRLHGLLAALLAFAALFVWRRFTPLVPVADETAAMDHVAGRTAASGFVNLLRRSIPADQLLAVCVAEWEKSFPRHPRIAAVRELARDPSVLVGYRNIRQLLSERQPFGTSPPPRSPSADATFPIGDVRNVSSERKQP